MAKRFIETDIWKKSWWRKLPPKIKLFYIYMICNCDHAGIWSDVDLELAEFQIGMPIDKKDIPRIHKITQRLIRMPGLSKRRTEVIFEESPSSPAFL